MENDPKKEDYTPVFTEQFRPFSGFSREQLAKVPLISQHFYSLVSLCLTDIENIKGINLAFSPIFIYAFAISEIAVLVTVYFFPLIVIVFWIILLVFFIFLHKRRKSYARVLRKSKMIVSQFSAQMGNIYLMELDVNLNSFLGWSHYAKFILYIKKNVLEALNSTPNPKTVVSSSSAVIAKDKVELYQVEQSKLKEYDSSSELSSVKQNAKSSSIQSLTSNAKEVFLTDKKLPEAVKNTPKAAKPRDSEIQPLSVPKMSSSSLEGNTSSI